MSQCHSPAQPTTHSVLYMLKVPCIVPIPAHILAVCKHFQDMQAERSPGGTALKHFSPRNPAGKEGDTQVLEYPGLNVEPWCGLGWTVDKAFEAGEPEMPGEMRLDVWALWCGTGPLQMSPGGSKLDREAASGGQESAAV
ncbi:hypothetical protein DHEL01_v211614 [Diaporthe helianthi]|uniref:Uncharacterized protein n=1 Tax=Diaporthe helianthi TaxID=158607 RepID=A0A2P5HIC2_DIAHE|nr:hypothetical protein DHEL01_v211614 [Diaporthe helianthi]